MKRLALVPLLVFQPGADIGYTRRKWTTRLEHRTSGLLHAVFFVNKAGTPSLATWVQVSGPAAPVANIQLHLERVPTPAYVFERKQTTESPLPLRKEMDIH